MTSILKDTRYPVIIKAIEENALEGCRIWAKRWPTMSLLEDENKVLTLTDIDYPLFNNILRLNASLEHIESAVEDALSPFRQRKIPAFWWAGTVTQFINLDRFLKAKQLVHAFQAFGMAMELDNLNTDIKIPDSLAIQRVHDTQTFKTWCDIVSNVYKFPNFVKEQWFNMYMAVGLDPDNPWRHYTASLNGKAVAASSLFLGAGVASVSNVATLPGFRRRGIGSAITRQSLHEARVEGFYITTLWASKKGMGVYKGMGYKEYCKGDCYLFSMDL
ncbi:MAG: hypothetical protein IEMM0008_0534 [bacterium]|nr:MAG: hypothetical protein IEMM0008_0534 [bacterium]